MTGQAARLALLCWVAAAVVTAGTWWDSGNQEASATQLPGVLVAVGAGLGFAVLGSALWGLDRARARGQREQALIVQLVDRAGGR